MNVWASEFVGTAIRQTLNGGSGLRRNDGA